jgi:hypothetical protein
MSSAGEQPLYGRLKGRKTAAFDLFKPGIVMWLYEIRHRRWWAGSLE